MRKFSWFSFLRHRNKVRAEANGSVAPQTRLLYVNDPIKTEQHARLCEQTQDGDHYYSNEMRTSKYNLANFVPKSLWEQFRRVANVYFLVISILQLSTNLSPTNKYSTIGPLALVLLVTMIKEALEDKVRHRQDAQVNHQLAHVILNDGHYPGLDRNQSLLGTLASQDKLPTVGNSIANGTRNAKVATTSSVGVAQAGNFVPTFWKDIRVGDVVKVLENEQIPADLVLLFASHPSEVMCETSSLDGESNLKERRCMPWNALSETLVPATTMDFGSRVHGEIVCELPNKRLYQFEGIFKVTSASNSSDRADIPISIENVALRGMKLSNTKWLIGVVVGAGNDTKLVRNMKAVPSKFSRLDRMVNKCIIVVFGLLFTACFFSSIQSMMLASDKEHVHVYGNNLEFFERMNAASFVKSWITYLILYNNMVPISLYIGLEIVKWNQARRIESDPQMKTVHGVTARTSNVNEDLGQIKYIFSDKTGTLTKNQMLFKVCSVGGVIYDGSSMNLRRGATVENEGSGQSAEVSAVRRMTKHSLLSEKDVRPYSQLLNLITSSSETKEGRHSFELSCFFFRCLLLCHTASVAVQEDDVVRESGFSTTTSKKSTTRSKERINRSYCGSSPDEVALLNAALEFGCSFEGRDGDVLHIRIFGNDESYRILALNEFESTRKCMSIVVRKIVSLSMHDQRSADSFSLARAAQEVRSSTFQYSADSDVLVFCKGADTVMFANAVNTQDISKLGLHVHYFASMALRTLLLGYKKMSDKDFLAWKTEYDFAKKSLVDRDKLCLEVAKKIETSIYLLGATGVEDLLQDGVKECIEKLSCAGIHVWMLTGDKDETAISVAHMCGLINERSKLVIIKGKTTQDCMDEIATARRKLKREGVWVPGVAAKNYALVINGEAMELLLCDANNDRMSKTGTMIVQAQHTNDSIRFKSNEGLGEEDPARLESNVFLHNASPASSSSHHRGSLTNRANANSARSSLVDASATQTPRECFIELATQCSSVVACRLSPMQKAQVVNLIKTTPENPLTLAVGDGGNDVSMIQESHVGIGIYGHEGMQAVRAADFAIDTFSHLSRLILVHGRWNHLRVANVVLFSFYKNIALMLTLVAFSFVNEYSGQTLFDSYLMVGWNVFYTLLPIFVLGIMDEDIRDEAVMQYPYIYRHSLRTYALSVKKLSLWVLNAIFHASIVFYFGKSTVHDITSAEGRANGLFVDGTAIYGILLVVVTMQAALTMQRIHRWTWTHYAALVTGFLLYIVFVLLYSRASALLPQLEVVYDFSGIAGMLLPQGMFWVLMLLVTIACIAPNVAVMYVQGMYLPSSVDIIREIDSGVGELMHLINTSNTIVMRNDKQSGNVDDSAMTSRFNPEKDLSSAIIAGEWSQKFRDFDAPSEHEEFSKQLAALQREIATEIGLSEPFSREENTQTSHSVRVQPPIHPLTQEFMGEEHQQLEEEYAMTFAHRERSRILFSLKLLAIVVPLYAVYEYTMEGEQGNLPIRVGYLVCDLIFLRFVRTQTFIDHYQTALVMPLGLLGITLTIVILDSGKFAATLYPIVIFVVVRVKFLYALSLAIFNFSFYVVAPILGLKRSSSESTNSTMLDTTPMLSSNSTGYENDETRDLILFSFHLCFIICFGAYACYSIQMTLRRDFLQSRSLLLEQKRSTQILKNMLPEHVVKRLQNGEASIAEDEKDVTILFCDIADFGSFMKRFTPVEVVSLLDCIYSLFDQICVKHGVRKMETVGKTYMACAGLQGKDRGKEAALRAASMALEMLTSMEKCRASNGNVIKLRIGIHSGRVISGLVGMKKQQFSLFGDTVNTASRMQSTGVTGKCQVSQMTYKKLAGHFAFEERQVQAKGKGLLTTYILGPPTSDVAKDFVMGQYDHTLKRESLYNDKNTGVLGVFDPDRIIQKAKIRWHRFDPLRFLLGSIGDERYTEMTTQVQTEMNTKWLQFYEEDMEYKYLESTMDERIEGARATFLCLAFYALFDCVRDMTVEVLDIDSFSGITVRDYGIILGPRLVFVVIAYLIGRQANENFFTYSETKLRNVLISFYSLAFVVLISTQVALWIRDRESVRATMRYTDLCLSLVLLMFVVSNGGSILFRMTVLFNVISMVVAFIVVLIGINAFSQGFETGFKKSYPIVLSCLSSICNLLAAYTVEFFARRKIWLQTRTQLETLNADRLLYQMLPAAVVMRLKEGELVCDQHQQVGILFSDIKGFTSIASQAKTAQVVNILASLFCAFDKLTEKHGVFKMQTIGDAYVIVSGLPYVDMSLQPAAIAPALASGSSQRQLLSASSAKSTISEREKRSQHQRFQLSRRSTLKHKFQMHVRSHIRDLLAMARDMHQEVRKVSDPNTGERLQMRIGIHIGNIIGGVIGTTTLRYDMWGPDALTANELESNGVPEHILVSPAVMEVVRGMPDIQCTFHKRINFTNMNMMDTYLVEFVEPPPGATYKSPRPSSGSSDVSPRPMSGEPTNPTTNIINSNGNANSNAVSELTPRNRDEANSSSGMSSPNAASPASSAATISTSPGSVSPTVGSPVQAGTGLPTAPVGTTPPTATPPAVLPSGMETTDLA